MRHAIPKTISITLILALLAGCAGPIAPYSDSNLGGANDLLQRLQLIGKAETIVSPTMLATVLGLKIGANSRAEYSAPTRSQPNYVQPGSVSLRIRRPIAGASNSISAMLIFGIDTSKICFNWTDVQRLFRQKGEVMRGFVSDGVGYRYLELRLNPKLNISFGNNSEGCVSRIIFSENCYTDIGQGCRYVLREY